MVSLISLCFVTGPPLLKSSAASKLGESHVPTPLGVRLGQHSSGSRMQETPSWHIDNDAQTSELGHPYSDNWPAGVKAFPLLPLDDQHLSCEPAIGVLR